MVDLIKALQILLKYGNPKYPTICSHDELTICGINLALVSLEDIAELERLSFHINEDLNLFYSFRFGSA